MRMELHRNMSLENKQGAKRDKDCKPKNLEDMTH
jgi:hypothetical protein